MLPFVKKHGADVIWAGGDLADNRGPIYGPEVFRTMLLPRLKRIVDKCHALELPYVFRTDGKLWSIADELFVESGIDGYGEIDVEAGMDIGRLRRRFPDLVLCGNVSCSNVLQFGSIDDVVRATRDCIDKARGGGHIVGSSNSLVHGTPAENVFAMMQTAQEYGDLSQDDTPRL
jgi:uroporphyrinogen decarboxylase